MTSSLFLFNTSTRKKELFTPKDPERVTMYVCGPTVYNYIHIGNARPAVVFDVLFRLLKRDYGTVIYARNITDVDDKIIAAAQENDESISEITARFTKAYREDVSALKTLAPTLEPFATEHIEEMIQLTQILMNKGHAYLAEANVLFSVQSMKDYGALSNRTIEDMLAGARVEIAQYKKHPGDFVLWKPSKSGEPGWDSPWGFGRPGWHLECSAMAHSHLGQDIDIHGGGRDLIFPHHENEIAQSCCAYGGNFVNHWMHNATVDIDGEKMSKSLGNIRTVRDLLKNYRGDVLKLALLSTHYRSPLNFSVALLEQSEKTLTSFYNGLREVDEIPIDEVNIADTSFYAALCDDLNTPLAISELHSMTKRINTGSSSEKRIAKSELLAAGSLLGLLDCEPTTWLQGGLDLISISPEEIESLILEREKAKKAKNYARADEIRGLLTGKGVLLEDSSDGTRWRRSSD